MKQRKINDLELLQMSADGKSKSYMARYFNCSRNAIYKRLEYLDQRRTLRTLEDTEQLAVKMKAANPQLSNSEIGRRCFPESKNPVALAQQVFKRPHVRQALSEVMESVGITAEHKATKIKDHIDNQDPNVSLKALDMANKVQKDYPPKESVNLNVNTTISPVDLERYRKIS